MRQSLKKRALDYIRGNPKSDAMDVAEALEISLAQAAEVCEQLMVGGKIGVPNETVGRNKGET